MLPFQQLVAPVDFRFSMEMFFCFLTTFHWVDQKWIPHFFFCFWCIYVSGKKNHTFNIKLIPNGLMGRSNICSWSTQCQKQQLCSDTRYWWSAVSVKFPCCCYVLLHPSFRGGKTICSDSITHKQRCCLRDNNGDRESGLNVSEEGSRGVYFIIHYVYSTPLKSLMDRVLEKKIYCTVNTHV